MARVSWVPTPIGLQRRRVRIVLVPDPRNHRKGGAGPR